MDKQGPVVQIDPRENPTPNAGGRAPDVISEQWLEAMHELGLDDDSTSKMLRTKSAYFKGTQHDHIEVLWSGVPRDPGVGYLWERLKPQGFVPVNNVPPSGRKPDAALPFARQIVSSFTDLLLGEGRAPKIVARGSDKTTAAMREICESADLWDTVAEARNKAGACGATAICVGVTGGRFELETLDAGCLWVPAWSTEEAGWVPSIVVEQKHVERQAVDPKTGKLSTVDVVRTRAWTATEVVYYEDVRLDTSKGQYRVVDNPSAEPSKHIPIKERKAHRAGRCPVVWYQNIRDSENPHGDADCEGVWHLLDKVDYLESQVQKAGFGNIDPSLLVKRDRNRRRRINLQKGGVIDLDKDDDASFLEMEGKSIVVGMQIVDHTKSEILQTVKCVIVTPENASSYQSGEAMQVLWRSMESRCNRLRVPLRSVIRQLAGILLTMADQYGVDVDTLDRADDADYQGGILLPPTEDGAAHEVDLAVSLGLEWPPYHTPTATQIATAAQGMATATGGKQTVSQETATKYMASLVGCDPAEESEALGVEMGEADAALQAQMSAGLAANPPGGKPPTPEKIPAEEPQENPGEDTANPQKITGPQENPTNDGTVTDQEILDMIDRLKAEG